MTTERLTAPATRMTTGWTGRASAHRRQQVRERDHVLAVVPPAETTPDGPVESLWRSLTEVLDALESPAQAMLCTLDGTAIVSYGYHRADLPSAAHLAAKMFTARRLEAVPSTPGGSGTLTVDLTSGLAHTVIAAFPTARGRHLLTISAHGVSLPVLQAWTRHTADRLSVTLGGHQDD